MITYVAGIGLVVIVATIALLVGSTAAWAKNAERFRGRVVKLLVAEVIVFALLIAGGTLTGPSTSAPGFNPGGEVNPMAQALFTLDTPPEQQAAFGDYVAAALLRRGTPVRSYYAGSFVLPNVQPADCDDLVDWLTGLAARFEIHFLFAATYDGGFRTSANATTPPGWPKAWALPLPNVTGP